MLSKSIKDFFKNPIIAIPNIVYALVFQIILYLPPIKKLMLNTQLLSNIESTEEILQNTTRTILFLLLIFIIYLFITPFILSWSHVMCKKVVLGDKPNFFENLKESLSYYWRNLGTSVLIGIIIFSVYMIFAILIISIVGVSTFTATNPENIDPSKLLILMLMLLFFLIVVLFLLICLAPVNIALFYDNINIGKALSTGFKFGLKNFFQILGVFLLYGLVIFTIVLPTTLIGESIIINLITTLINSYLSLFPIIYMMNLYRNEKFKEAFRSTQPNYNNPYQISTPPYNNNYIHREARDFSNPLNNEKENIFINNAENNEEKNNDDPDKNRNNFTI